MYLRKCLRRIAAPDNLVPERSLRDHPALSTTLYLPPLPQEPKKSFLSQLRICVKLPVI